MPNLTIKNAQLQNLRVGLVCIDDAHPTASRPEFALPSTRRFIERGRQRLRRGLAWRRRQGF
jgi:hypothetical protein